MRIIKSFFNAFQGIIQMLRYEKNFQIEILALITNLFLIVYLKLNPTDSAIILMVCFAVLSAEFFNSAIEKICNKIQPEFDMRIKVIKDISAGAVLILAISSIFVGILIYGKYV